ncbi:MAG: MopE-related protein [Chitinophagales bacterium]
MKTVCCYFIFLLFTYKSYAQAPDIEWQNTIGGGSSDNLQSLALTIDGGYILGGSSGSTIFGDKTEDNIGLLDYWIVKLNGAGNIEWQNTIGGTNTDDLYVIRQTADIGYIAGGYSESGISGDKTEANIGSRDYWVVKLDSLGDIQWQKTLGGTSDDVLYDIEQTQDRGYILAGASNSEISGNKTEANKGSYDYWIIKLDSLGELVWQKVIGGDDVDVLHSIKQTLDLGYIIGGHSRSLVSGDKTESCILKPSGLQSQDYWVLKLDSTGNIEWQNVIGGNIDDFQYSLDLTTDGNYISGGISNSGISADKTEENYGLSDYWVVYIGIGGEVLLQKTLGGSNDDNFQNGCISAYSSYIAAGYSLSGVTGNKTEPNIGMDDYWIVKVNVSGDIIWQLVLGGSNTDRLYQILATPDGGYIAGGLSASDISGTKTENSIGNSDYWVIKFFPDTSCMPITFYEDIDGDGFGNPDYSVMSCDSLEEYVTNTLDCNDLNADINPGMPEICNGLDDNCNTMIDEDLPLYIYYADNDYDGFGGSSDSIIVCFDITPSGYSIDNSDCDDSNEFTHEPILYYADTDGDFFGDVLNAASYCSIIPPADYVSNSLDCNDTDPLINPFSNEVCNGEDDNCNDLIDEDLPVYVLNIDTDGDGFGFAETDTSSCDFEISGFVSNTDDCDDTNPFVNPYSNEIENGIDDNCNDTIDEGYTIIESLTEDYFRLYPNPNTGTFSIDFLKKHGGNFLVEIYSLQDQILYAVFLPIENNLVIELPDAVIGTVIVKIISDSWAVSKIISVFK